MTELTAEVFERLLIKQLEGFSTKKELAALATKKDLDGLATKKDLGDGFDELAEMIQFLTKAAAHKEDLKPLAGKDQVDKKFAEQAISLTFIESNVSTLRKDLEQLSKRAKEDDGAFVKEILKLKNRMDQFEKQLKKLRVAHV